MTKTIDEEIIDYLKEYDLYFEEEYDEDGFPIINEANDLIGDLTNAEFSSIVKECMEDIAEIAQKKCIKNACKTFCRFCPHQCEGYPHSDCQVLNEYKKAMEEQA